MAVYEIKHKDVGTIRVFKKRGMRSMRLRITPDGTVAVSAPWYVPKLTILAFIESKKAWLQKHQTARKVEFYDGLKFGRNMTLNLHENAPKNRSRLGAETLDVFIGGLIEQNTSYIRSCIHRALKQEAEHVLLPRLHELSKRTGLEFNQAFVKHLTGRWGSCDSQKNILLSFFLVQLPDELIDYVIIHELVHTKHMNHSASFWNNVERLCPNYKTRRKFIKTHDPRIIERGKV